MASFNEGSEPTQRRQGAGGANSATPLQKARKCELLIGSARTKFLNDYISVFISKIHGMKYVWPRKLTSRAHSTGELRNGNEAAAKNIDRRSRGDDATTFNFVTPQTIQPIQPDRELLRRPEHAQPTGNSSGRQNRSYRKYLKCPEPPQPTQAEIAQVPRTEPTGNSSEAQNRSNRPEIAQKPRTSRTDRK